ncbi:Pyruvate kinase [Planctomycetes bacterium Poly30]|uniref:Pyruvate kinase n=1 Tax=Saltatorellus ferox TaxID=2528018 RepID=A0A518EXR1_9BACT|nr:Pyruvate kinase [Planctomycetes bacterium Poly30]
MSTVTPIDSEGLSAMIAEKRPQDRVQRLPARLLPPHRRSKGATRFTKIVATIGPASEDRLEELIDAGLSVARLNFSHGSADEHRRRMAKIKAASAHKMTPIAVLADLPGPKMRTGMFPDGKITLNEGDIVRVKPGQDVAAPGEVYVGVDDLLEAVHVGHRISLADGQVLLRATAKESDAIVAKCERAGPVGNRKGVHLPDSDVKYELPTDEDRELIELARELGVDMLGVSFVGHASELEEIRGLAPGIHLVSKIERQAALFNLDEILEATDGLMVARGDLGVELDLEHLPLVQKEILERAVRAGVYTITATEMLESMIEAGRPTRAEVTDVANAVLDGTDAVMLSAETAVGKHPVEAVATMAKIAQVAERSEIYSRRPSLGAAPERVYFSRATAMAAVHVAKEVDVDCIVCFTETGNTVRLLSRFRPDVEIVALSPRADTVRQMAVLAHVRPLLFRREPSLEAMIDTAADLLVARRIVETGDRVIFVAGVPVGFARSTNVLKLHRIGEDSRFA